MDTFPRTGNIKGYSPTVSGGGEAKLQRGGNK